LADSAVREPKAEREATGRIARAQSVLAMADPVDPVEKAVKAVLEGKEEKEDPAESARILRSLTQQALLALTMNYSEDTGAIRVTPANPGSLGKGEQVETLAKRQPHLTVLHPAPEMVQLEHFTVIWVVVSGVRSGRRALTTPWTGRERSLKL
jgi:hypothetical protein